MGGALRGSRNPGRVLALLACGPLLATTAGCGLFGGDAAKEPGRAAPAALTVQSSAFADGARIPQTFSCHGRNVSPPLQWSGVTTEAQSVAVVVDDPDAPGGTYVHWVLFNLPSTRSSLGAGQVPAGARQATNSAGHAAYDGPCPPAGKPHHYRFVVYALDAPLRLPDGADRDTALLAIDKRAIARGLLVGTYGTG